MPPYLLTSILFGSAVLCAVLTLYTWRRRTVAGTRYLMLVLVGSILSMIGYGLGLITPDLPGKLLFVQIRYLGTALATPAFVLSALWYAGRERWLASRYMALIALLPALSEILFLFNDWHHLHYVTVGLAAASGFPQLVKTNGPLYWLYIIHSLAYVILAAGVTLHTLLTASRSQRRQAGLAFAATSIPLFATLIYLAGLRPYGFFNFTPLAFSITGLTLGLAIFRYKLLDLRPIAYRAALDRSLMGVIVLDRTGRIADLNRAAQTLLNVQLREALDQPVSQVCREWPALTERLARGPAINEDVVWERAGLQRVYAIETASLQADGQVLLLHDVTAQRAAEQRTLAQQRLSATLEERERLARELHDGIAQVVGYVSLETGKALEDLAQHRVDAAQTTLTHLRQVAQDAHADLRDFILGVRTGEATVKGFFPTLEKYLEQLRVNYHLPVTLSRPTDWPDDLIGPGVEAQLLRVIQEALTNVRKHAQASSSSVTFTLSATTVQVIIADNGCGFTPAPPDADATAHFGLPMMRERLAEIGGTVEVRSAIGLGTQVVVQAPRRVAQSEHLVGLRVLIADDQPLFRDGLRNLLTARGVRCVGLAENGRQACELARQVQPDLVLLDVNMPDMDGLAALKEIKAEQPHLKVVMLTVADTSTLLREALNAGANGFLLKNLTPTEFFSLLDRLARGETVVAPDLAARVLQETVTSDELSARQQRILALIAQGKTNKEIAAEFVLTEAAIKYHVGQILERLGAATRDEAVTLARQRGWLD